MAPKKPMSPKEVESNLKNLQNANTSLQNENALLKEDIEILKTDKLAIKDDKIIKDFIDMNKTEILGLSASEKYYLMFSVLKALCRDKLDKS